MLKNWGLSKNLSLPPLGGVAVLVGLLAMLPWLPIGSAEPEVRGGGSARPSRVEERPMWDYTVHLVASEAEYRALLPRFPSTSSHLIVVMQPGQDLAHFRSELDAQRAAQSLPPARIVDRRVRP